MKLKVDGIELNVIPNYETIPRDKTPIIFLHGFTGCADDWSFIFEKLPSYTIPFAIDLIGHGDSDSPDDQSQYSCGAIIHQIDSIIQHLGFQNIILAGYSMGGRAAISYSLKYPHKVIAAVLESSTAGIIDISERKIRAEHDLLLSDKMKKEGMEWFMNFWLNLPMFKSLQDKYELDELINDRTNNNLTGLSNVLASFSTGLMSSYWEELYYLDFPVLLMCGELDKKFTSINREMSERFKNVQLKIIDNTGHNIHLEKPELFTKLVIDFLNTLER